MSDDKSILIADDHAAIRRGVKMILNAEISSLHMDEAFDGNEALKKIRGCSWNAIILDIDLPVINGYEVLKIMQNESIRVPVLVFSFHSHPTIENRVMELGATAFLSKYASPSDVVTTIKRILA